MKKPRPTPAADEESLFPRGQADWRAPEASEAASPSAPAADLETGSEARPAKRPKKTSRERPAVTASELATPAAPVRRPGRGRRTLVGFGVVATVASAILVLRPLRPLASRSEGVARAPAPEVTVADAGATSPVASRPTVAPLAPPAPALAAPPAAPTATPVTLAAAPSPPRPAAPSPASAAISPRPRANPAARLAAARVLDALADFCREREGDSSMAEDAALALAPMGPDAIRDAILLLEAGDERRLILARALGATAPAGLAQIGELLRERTDAVFARTLLGGIPACPEALDLVAATFADEPEHARRQALVLEYARRVLGESGGSDASTALERTEPDPARDRAFLESALRDPAPPVRVSALALVGRRRDQRDADLVRALIATETDGTVRRAANAALARLGGGRG